MPIPVTFIDWCELFLLFIAYSFLGWCGEMLYCSIPRGKLCEKRGFLNGLICPIYGHGALLVLYALRGGFRNPVLTFFFGLLLTSALEYFTSWLMEIAFHMRWWDYSHYKFQINGRVCLLNSTCFGLACVLLCHVVHPRLWSAIQALGAMVVSPLAAFLLGIYLTDTVLSIRSAIQLGNRMQKLHELQGEVRAHLAERREEFSSQLTQYATERRERSEKRIAAFAEDFLHEMDSSDDFPVLDEYLADHRERMRRLRDGQDIFERRLLHSHPNLRTPHESILNALREYRAKRSDHTKDSK